MPIPILESRHLHLKSMTMARCREQRNFSSSSSSSSCCTPTTPTPALDIDRIPHHLHSSIVAIDIDHLHHPTHTNSSFIISSSSSSSTSSSSSMMSNNQSYTRRRRFRATIATAAAAAMSMTMISSHSLPVVEAFSIPSTATSRPTLRANNNNNNSMPVSARRSLQLWWSNNNDNGIASTLDEPPPHRHRGPLHLSSSQLIKMSIYELLSVGRTTTTTTSSLSSSHNHQRMIMQHPRHHLGSSPFSRLEQHIGSGSRSISATSTSLSVSRSTDNVLGFRVEDFDPSYNMGGSGNKVIVDDELPFSFEDFGNFYEDDLFITPATVTLEGGEEEDDTMGRLSAIRTKKSGQQQLQQQQRGIAIRSSSRSTRPKSKSITGEESGVPPWLPWVPTESQINLLKKVELCAACAERGLITTGNKAALQQRLLIWATVQDRRRVKNRLSGLKDLIELSKSKEKIISVDVDVEGVLSYDVKALTDKRKALTKEKKRTSRGGVTGKNHNRGILGLVDESYFSNSTGVVELEEDDDEEDEDDVEESVHDNLINEESISQLSKTFNAPSSTFSNREVREMYIEAKVADQAGDRTRSKEILTQLREATPHDMRVVRRLARMEQEDGNLAKARTILLDGLRMEQNNAYLLNGLGQIERISGNVNSARTYYRRAIKCNPSIPNPYHALGTLEHTHGNIRAALTIIKDGIRNCPRNHRLYHALGDVYLDANMLDMAEEAYLTGLQLGPEWSKAFFYTSLSFVSYAQGHSRDSRALLVQSLQINGGMHAQGVIALAQLDESEGNIAQARKVYRDAISSYERKRHRRSSYRPTPPSNEDNVFDTWSSDDGQGTDYSRSYAGDKWINVFKSWARMEEIHGTYETAHIVYSKAAKLFPNNVSLLIQWAELQANHGEPKKARLLFEAACHRVGSKSAEPYQLLAEFEMKRKNYFEAQSILSKGAQSVAGNDSSLDNDEEGAIRGGNKGLARLFHTWGVCEYHLGVYSRAEKLFDDALRVTGSEEGDSAMRSLILYSMAKLEYSRQEYLLAQHCVALSLKENLLPGGNYLTWKLWSQIADKMENEELATRCKEQALLRREQERGGAAADLSRLLGERNDKSSNNRLPERTGSAMKDMFRKTPWYNKVCPPSARMDKIWFNGAMLWEWA